MKILTLNTHSLRAPDYRQKLEAFIDSVLEEKPDLIAMQEVNQTPGAGEIETELLEGQYPIPGSLTICRDNHAARVAHRLRQAGIECSWVWIPIRLGELTEGVAILSLGRKIRCVDRFPISKEGEQNRAVLGVQVEGLEDWFYTVQLSRFEDAGFLEQWKKLNCCLGIPRIYGPVWLLCDLNGTARGESYATIAASGWLDTHLMARSRSDGPADRQDFIWCSEPGELLASRVLRPAGPLSPDFALLVEFSHSGH